MNKLLKAGFVGVVAITLTATATASGPKWTEMDDDDAGGLPGDSQTPMGHGPLQRLNGNLGTQFLNGGFDSEDMYRINIVDPQKFRVTTDPDDREIPGGFATFNSQLWLFKPLPANPASAKGFLGNDDHPDLPPSLLSLLIPIPTDGSPPLVEAGIYYIAITRSIIGEGKNNNDPVSIEGEIFNQKIPMEISGPDGPGGEFKIIGWTGDPGDPFEGMYEIRLRGVEYLPQARFFGDPAEFEEALKADGKVLKGIEDFPWEAGPGGVIGVDDPLDVNTAVPGWIQPGVLLDNITYQSNLDPFGANGPNPRGDTGLALFTTGFIGATNNGLVANHFVDSLDILSGPPAGDNHTAMAMQVVSFNNSPAGSDVVVSVYDKNDNLIGTSASISAPANLGGAFLGIVTTGVTIGRVNLYDTTPGFDAEGVYNLKVYVLDEPDPCPWDLDGNGDVGVGDLLILLANWGNPYGVPDLLRMLAAWGPCP